MSLECHLLSSLEKVFCSPELKTELPLPDSGLMHFTAVRGEIVAFQIAMRSRGVNISVQLHAETDREELGSSITLREVRSVPCAMPGPAADDFMLRNEPSLYPDPLCPVNGPLRLSWDLWYSVYVTIQIPADARPGRCGIKLFLDQVNLPGDPWPTPEEQLAHLRASAVLDITAAVLPEQKLICTNWFYADCLAEYYHVRPWTEHFWKILENYFQDFAFHGRNLLLTPLWTVPLDTAIGGERPTVQLLEIEYSRGRYRFDFTRLKRWIDLAKKCGVTCFEMSHFFTQWGAKFTPKIIVKVNGRNVKKFGWHVSAVSPEYREFLNALLPKLTAFLRKESLAGKCYFHISDEPPESVIDAYRAASEPIRKYLKDEEFPIIDALSAIRYFKEGLLKRPVPFLPHLEEFSRESIAHRWCYYCGSTKNFPARSYGMPSCRCRILGVLFYLYRIEGFLHWGHNFWFSTYSLACIDPWKDTTAGGSFIGGNFYNVYPGPDGRPVDSLRYEAFTAALQDLRLLELVESRLGREKTVALIQEGVPYPITVDHIPHEASYLESLHSRLVSLLEKN